MDFEEFGSKLKFLWIFNENQLKYGWNSEATKQSY